MRVRDMMSSPAQACRPNESVAAAAAAMKEQGVGALPVLDESGLPVGILTDRDVCVAIARNGRVPDSILVRDAMTRNPHTCTESAPLEHALGMMASCRIRRLPVVDPKGRVIGIISLTDVLEATKDAADSDVPLLRRTLSSLRQISRRRRSGHAAIPIPVRPGPPPPSF